VNLNYALSAEQYQVSCGEAAFFPFYSPYAMKHWEMACSDKNHGCGHKVIAILEFIPIIGAISSIFERIIVSANDCCHKDPKSPTAIHVKAKKPSIKFAETTLRGPTPLTAISGMSLESLHSVEMRTNINEMTIKEFMEFVVSKHANGKQYSFLTNCIKIQDISFVFLGDMHNYRPIHEFNSSIINLLWEEGDQVFVETDKKLAHTMIDPLQLPGDAIYQQWDDVEVRDFLYEKHFEPLARIGLIYQRFIEVFLEKPHADDSFEKIAQTICEISQSSSCDAKPRALLNKIKMLEDTILYDLRMDLVKTLSPRQIHMIGQLKKSSSKAHKNFIVGGITHFVNSKAPKPLLEPLLAEYLKDKKYLAIFIAIPITAQEISKEPTTTITDFRTPFSRSLPIVRVSGIKMRIQAEQILEATT
jgi:hypothetical protein